MLLSIIIPCYNSERFIGKTLSMLVSQGLDDCEVIVVNDGSSDTTAAVVQSFTDKYSCIRVINKVNEGVSVARNTGMQAAAGTYIYFLDSDDTLADGTLDFYRSVLTSNPGQVFFGFGYYSVYQGCLKKDYAASAYDGKTFDALLLKKSFLMKKLFFHICSCIYERAFLNGYGITFTAGEKIGEDVEFLLNVIRFAPGCVYYARHCFIYQIRDDSTMRGYKGYSKGNFKGFELVNSILTSSEYQESKIKTYSNCLRKFNYLRTFFYYMRSSVKDSDINEGFLRYAYCLRYPYPKEAPVKLKLLFAAASVLPLRMLLCMCKTVRINAAL